MSAVPKAEQCGELFPLAPSSTNFDVRCQRVKGHTEQHQAWKPNGDLLAEWVVESPMVMTGGRPVPT